MKVDVNIFDYASVQKAKQNMEEFCAELPWEADELCRRLAEIGATSAKVEYAGAYYDGTNDVGVEVEPIKNGYRIRAHGNAVLFIEFGSGTIGFGHPDPGPYGPGTWSDGPNGKGHWSNPNGWYYAHGLKSVGNPPAAAMYHARREVEEWVYRIAEEIFG